MKRVVSGALVAIMAISMAACAQSNSSSEQTKGMTPGTYTASAYGMKDYTTVEVTVDETSIVDIKVTECKDTKTVCDAAVAEVPAAIIENQSVAVDGAAGATMTSFAIKNAVTDCLTQAGADLATFKTPVNVEKTEGRTEDYDIVIVGGGMSGVSAAIEAARKSDLKVIVLEKESWAGGSGLVCGGGIWAINSDVNKTIGQDSTLDEYIGFMEEFSGKELNRPLLTAIYNKCNDVISYYLENGLPVNLETWSLGNPENQLPVLWSDGANSESGLVQSLIKMAEDLGVEIRTNADVVDLISTETGVTGVKVEGKTSTYTVNAKKVILATGGFTHNAEMVKEYAPEYTSALPFTAPGEEGDGLTMVMADFDVNLVGDGMMGLMGTSMQNGYYYNEGPLVWSPTLVVNKEGENTPIGSMFYGRTLLAICQQTDGQVYGIFDSASGSVDTLEGYVESGAVTKYDTLDALAQDKGIDAATLATTGANLAEGPYYCLVIKPVFIGSITGLEVDEACHVLTKDGTAIENLYACGEVIFGNLFNTAYPSSGTGMASSAYTGAIAASTAISEING